jgi:hypothetical protein
MFEGNRAWFRFTFKWADPKTGEPQSRVGMQSYGTEGDKQNVDPKAGEVIGVEGEDAPYPVHVHHGYQPRVVNFNSLHAVRDDEALPFPVGRGRIPQQRQDALDFFDFGEHERDGKAEAVVRQRAGRDIPEFRDVLRREANRLIAGEQLRHARHCNLVLRIGRLSPAQQNIGIDENAHLAARAMHIFAADRVVRERGGRRQVFRGR